MRRQDMNLRQRCVLYASAVITVIACWCPTLGYAADYPDRQIRLVVPYTPGGPADILARLVAQKMTAELGQPVIVENRPGAGLSVGANYVANAKPDGYTLLVGAASMLIDSTPSRTPEQNLHDFVPISEIGTFPVVVVVNKDLPVKSMPALLAYAKQHPGQLAFSSSGIGSLTHMAGALLDYDAKIDIKHVPYRGINEALTDVVAGRVQMAFPGAPIGLPLAKTGRVRVLAVAGAQRTASAPDLPTVAESGVPGYDVTPWYGILAPRGTPPAVVQRWHDGLVKVLQQADIKARWLSLGADATYSATPEAFGKMMADQTATWANLVRQAGIKLR